MQSRRKILICALILIASTFALAQTPFSILGVDAPHGDSTKLANLCADCHFGYNALNQPATLNDKCLSCHNGTTAPAAESHRGMACTTCHNPHHQEQERAYGSTYSKLVKTNINGHTVKLMASSGTNSFADGDGTRDGVCEVCHTTTKYHRNDGTGQSHNNGANCTTCHPHDLGFAGAAGGPNCLGCHQYAMGSRRPIGTDFSSSKPHHPLTFNSNGNLTSPVDNNCLICHNDYPNQHANGTVNLRAVPDSAGVRNDSTSVGNNRTTWCLKCHDGNNPDPQYRLSGQIGSDKRPYLSGTNAHTGYGVGDGCNACHDPSNGHQQPIQFFSSFYLDGKEENNCYGCHGGGANVSYNNQYMENIRVAYLGGSVSSRSSHVDPDSLSTTDGHVFCRNCHDPHLLNHTTNLLIDPQNITQPWTGTRNDFCLRCHDGSRVAAPTHTGVTLSSLCTDCHLPHSSTLPSLASISQTGKTLSVTPASSTITVGGSQQFNSIVTPAYTQYTQAVVNKLSEWNFVATSGGSAGSQYNKADPIPLDRSIGYDPNGNGGWGLITVTSTITIPDNTTIEDLDVYANVTHHYRGDIELDLTHVETGKTVHVQVFDWNDWVANLIFWYNSESPNSQHGSASPRSTAQSLKAFNGELTAGTWILTIRDTWPSDNSTNPSSPDYCVFNSWALKVNGNVIGSFSQTGQFLSMYAGTGTVYSRLHNGKIIPEQNGLSVGVSENPLPLQATASFSVSTALGKTTFATIPSEQSYDVTPLVHPTKTNKKQWKLESASTAHSSNSGKSCISCHGR